MPTDQKEAAHSALEEYETLAEQIFAVVSQIHQRQAELDELDQSIDPVLVALLASVDTQVGLARLQIEGTRQLAVGMLAAATLSGLVSAGLIAVGLHYSVTRKIVNLTQVARHFHDGDLDTRARIESSEELGELAGTFNRMAGAVKRLNSELREQAIRDSLTGLFNRRYLDETLPRELAREIRTGNPVTLVMLDMDNLKEINDRYGHSIGDRMLIELGKVLKSHIRRGDVACRFGGDEFIVLLPGADLDVGLKRAELLRQKFKDVEVVHEDILLKTTLSAGVVEWNPGETPAGLLSRVDAALYLAKNSGRDQVNAPS